MSDMFHKENVIKLSNKATRAIERDHNDCLRPKLPGKIAGHNLGFISPFRRENRKWRR